MNISEFVKLNKYWPFIFIYFFINSLALPFGLTYTTLLAPLFYVWILFVRKRDILLPFLLILSPFILMHLQGELEWKSYLLSLLNLVMVYIFCQAAYTFFITCKDPEKFYRRLLIINFVFCIVALLAYLTPIQSWFWMEQNISVGLEHFRRLKMLTYEPSYYAMLWVPIFSFFLLQYLFGQNKIPPYLLLTPLFLPFVLSFSIGVIGAILIAGLLTHIIYFSRLSRKRRIFNLFAYTGVSILSAGIVAVSFFRHNPIFSRLLNIFSGKDTSGKGRTIDAFILAQKILRVTNEYWGAGLGQIKWVGADIIRSYYLYSPDFQVAIPNAAAETLAIFGWVGFSLRILLELALFYFTRVWANYYRLLLFLFIFIYQFTGSFITNGAEYVIWILAFTRVFPQFDVPGLASRAQRTLVSQKPAF